MAEEEASFRISIDSMSEGLICDRLPASPMGNPSTTISGVFEPLSELLPRIRTTAPAPGSCEVFMICNPAARPCNSPSIDGAEMSLMASIFTETTDPVRSLFFMLP